MQLIDGSELEAGAINGASDSFLAPAGGIAVVVDSGSVVLEMKIGSEFYIVTEPTDQYYRGLIMTGKSVNMFTVPEADTEYRIKAVTQTEDSVSARVYSIAAVGGSGITWQP